MADGSECIVSVKTKVVLIAKDPNLIECDIDVSGFRDDSNFVLNLKFNLTDLFVKNFPISNLHLTTKYAHKLFIDCIVVSHASHPLSLITMAAYLALSTTRLPLLVSEIDDAEVEEQPTFADDWEKSTFLKDVFKMDSFQPPLFLTFGAVGDNIVVDPSPEEEQIIENGFLVAWYDNKVISPVSNVNLATNSNNPNFKGTSVALLLKATSTAKSAAPQIVQALDLLVQQELQDADGTVF